MAKVLLIDDDKAIQDIISMMLSRVCDHEVICASDGKQGLESLTKNPDIKIVFCDYNMPNLDGYGFSREVRKGEKYKSFSSLPIIGIGDFPESRRGFLTEFKQKPVRFTELDEYIKKYCI